MMAPRIQVLHLPSDADGEHVHARYALVVDQAAELVEDDRTALRAFASELGAQGCLVVSGAVDAYQGHDVEQVDEALGEQLGEVFRAAATQQAQPQQKQKLAPANTVEGKLQRTWGGQQTLEAQKEAEGDPQP